MIGLAKKKMPKAELFQGDFSKGLVDELEHTRYDAIIATYSLHHLSDEQKIIYFYDILKVYTAEVILFFLETGSNNDITKKYR